MTITARDLTRRQFLKHTGAAAGVVVAGQSVLGCGFHRKPTCPAAPVTPFLRRDVGGLTATDPLILAYRRAIKAMQALPASDPRSWSSQAAIATTLTTPLTANLFWPWHRMRLYWFERIVRKMSGDTCWTLPFWDWSAETQRQLPPMFRDATSELYTAHRNPAMNDGTGSLPAGDVRYEAAFALTSFDTASSIIQVTPHGAIQADVGGGMTAVATAAQDPLFYLHHCNMDRLWNLWLAQQVGRSDPLHDATWKSTAFTFFDENGKPVTMTSCDVVRAAQQLHYGYEGEPTQIEASCEPPSAVGPAYARELVTHLVVPPIVLGAKRFTFNLDVRRLRRRLTPLLESPTDTLLLELADVEADRPPGVAWAVFIGLPDGAALNTATSPYFVGNVALFATGIRLGGTDVRSDSQPFEPARILLPIDTALRRALIERRDRIPVLFASHGIDVDGKPTRPEPAATVRIGAVNVLVERQAT